MFKSIIYFILRVFRKPSFSSVTINNQSKSRNIEENVCVCVIWGLFFAHALVISPWKELHKDNVYTQQQASNEHPDLWSHYRYFSLNMLYLRVRFPFNNGSHLWFLQLPYAQRKNHQQEQDVEEHHQRSDPPPPVPTSARHLLLLRSPPLLLLSPSLLPPPPPHIQLQICLKSLKRRAARAEISRGLLRTSNPNQLIHCKQTQLVSG